MQKLANLNRELRDQAAKGSPRCRIYVYLSSKVKNPDAVMKAIAALKRPRMKLLDHYTTYVGGDGKRLFHGVTNKQLRSEHRTVFERMITELDLPEQLVDLIQSVIFNDCDHLSNIQSLIDALLIATPNQISQIEKKIEIDLDQMVTTQIRALT